jgi:ribosomal-protein-alanine N-acetyltransferase
LRRAGAWRRLGREAVALGHTNMPFPDSFATPRLLAERLTPEHAADVRRMDHNPQFMAMLGGPRDAAQTDAYLARNLQHWTDYGYGLWILREARQNGVVGRAVLRHLILEGRDEVEVGYGFYPECWGRGLATEIAGACLHYGREELHLRSVVAITLPAHLRSQRVMTKVGVVYERDVTHEGLPHVLFRSRWGAA